LNDNGGETDEHLWPFAGKHNWPALIEELVEAKYDGSFIFEVAGSNDLSKGYEAQSRLTTLWDEAQNSIEEFRLKYGLPGRRTEEES
jgi:sugar phosphate isomerase/epimerase